MAQAETAAGRRVTLRRRPDIAFSAHRYRRQRYWSLKDPAALRYFQLQDEEYAIWRLLNGRRSLDEIKVEFERRFAPYRISLSQLQAFVGRLHEEGLLVADTDGQAEQLLLRRGRQRRAALRQTLSSVLAIRFRGLNPQGLLDWLYPKCRWMFAPRVLGGVACAMLAALLLFLFHIDAVRERLPEFQAFFNTRNLVWLMAATATVKVLHEFGHALACRHFGAECHELGLMLLVFTPCLYCNVTDAWMLPSKWQRVAVSAAGMIVELTVAAAAMFVWWLTVPGMLNLLALDLIFVCSVSTILFNGNPLLRYDGYFILADLWETPNLQQQASSLARQTLAKWTLGLELGHDRLLPRQGRALLISYAVASTVYRWMLTAGVLWFCLKVLKPYRLELLGQLFAASVVGGLLLVPLWQAAMFFRNPVAGERYRWRQVGWRMTLLVLIVFGLLLIPLPYRISTSALLQPHEARRVYVSAPGRLLEAARVGSQVDAGQTLARLENLEVGLEVARLQGLRDQQHLHLTNLERRRIDDPAAGSQIPTARQTLTDLDERLAKRNQDVERLTIKSPVAGAVLPPPSMPAKEKRPELPGWSGTPLDTENRGAYLETGTLLCLVGEASDMEAVLIVDQQDVMFVQAGQRVWLSLDEAPGRSLSGVVTEVAQSEMKLAPRELLAGGDLATKADKSGRRHPLATSYQALVTLDEHHAPLLSGAAGRAKIAVSPQSLGRRLYRYLSRTFRVEL